MRRGRRSALQWHPFWYRLRRVGPIKSGRDGQWNCLSMRCSRSGISYLDQTDFAHIVPDRVIYAHFRQLPVNLPDQVHFNESLHLAGFEAEIRLGVAEADIAHDAAEKLHIPGKSAVFDVAADQVA